MLNLVIHSSHQLTWLIGLLYTATGTITWLYLPLPPHLKGIAMILHSIHFYLTWYHALSLQPKDSIIYLEYTNEKKWLLANRDGELYEASLQRGSVCTRQIAALHFKLLANDEHRYVWLLPDSLSVEGFRQLRQVLWWGL